MRLRVNPGVMILLGFSATLVQAQEANFYIGAGSAHDSSNGAKIETFGDGSLYKTPNLGGLWGIIGGNVFVNKQVGIGAEVSWKSQSDYAGIQYRPSFYNFDAIYQPAKVGTRRLAPEFRLGIGGMRIHYFPDDPSFCDQLEGCPASHHFQVHFAAAARWYLTDHLFLRPALDVHYVNNLFEFGSNWVPRYSVGIGYGFGR